MINKRLIRIVTLLLIAFGSTFSGLYAQSKLWYNKPAQKWTEALPIGNGRLGAMLFGGIGTDRIQFNEETLWNGEPRDYNKQGAYQYLDTIRQLLFAGKQKEAETLAGDQFMGLKSKEGKYEADYQPFGDLWLKFDSSAAVSDYKRELNIFEAFSRVSYTMNGVKYKREYLASQPNQVIAIHVTADKKSSISFEASISSPHVESSVKQINKNTIALSLHVQNGALHGESYLQVKIKKGSLVVKDGKIMINNADEAELYLTAGTNYINYHDVSGDAVAPCTSALNSIERKTWQQVKDAHIKEYQKLYRTFSIDLGQSSEKAQIPTDERIRQFASTGDPGLVSIYVNYGRYLLISSSRPGTRPANLQGIWNDLLSPPWGSKYTTNINAEMNYWPAELLNLRPMHEPLFKMIEELSQAGKETAKEYYNAPGWVLHHNTDLWRGTAAINASNHGIWVSGGAWLCHHLWEHYLFTLDTAFLKNRAYPIMKEAALFFNTFLIKDPTTGWLISTPSNSPENGGLVAGPTMDHQIIRDLFKNVIAASEVLSTDEALRKTLQEKYKQIAPDQIGKYGQLQEWLQDKDDTSSKHRHVSHLWGLYPGNEINYEETPELVKAARQSLIYRGDAATGWSLGWKINFWARFKDGNHSYKLLQMLLSPADRGAGSYPNLFDAHPPFQIDGNFGGAAGIGEMFIQSHTKYVDLLPALPDALPYGYIKGICARGGLQLDIYWADGKLKHVMVIDTKGNGFNLRYSDKVISMPKGKPAVYYFDGSLKRTGQ